MEKAGKKTWLDLLYENVKGFREAFYKVIVHKTVSAGGGMVRDVMTDELIHTYFVKGKKAVFIIDGIQLDSAISLPTFKDLTTYLDFHNAEDIKGIEVNLSEKYSTSYIREFITDPWSYNPGRVDYAYIEITTRGGNGPFFGNTPGVYLYKPLPLSWPKAFYKPRYAAKDIANHPEEIRPTIDWEPNINTNAKGEANVWFYAGDKPSNYTLIIEGTDRNGNLGYATGKVNVK
jgi:hypothetical protein